MESGMTLPVALPNTFANQTSPVGLVKLDENFTALQAGLNGLGSMAEQSSVNVSITGGSITGIIDLSVADGGTGASTASGARNNLGATTVGGNLFTLPNPSAITFVRLNADNSVSTLNAADFRTAIGVGTGTGSVLSVDVSGGTTGLTTSGGPITTSGTITLSGTLAVANGGTGSTTASGARSNLSAAASGANSDITSLSGLTTALSVAQGGTGATTAANARTGLGLAIGTDVQGYSAQLASVAGLVTNGIVARTAANTVTARSLAAGSTKISITNGDGVAGNPSIDVAEANLALTNIGGTLTIAKGGTGATDAATARTNLGLGTASDVTFNTASDAKGNLRSIPLNSQTAAYVLVAADAGKFIRITTGGVTVNTGIFAAGDAITIYNNSASNQTITQGASVTMYLGGTATTGNRTLAQRGVCTLLCVDTNTFVISGAGLT